MGAVAVEMCKDDLTTIFSHFGRVEHVDVPKPRAGSLPFAFVHFETEEDARLCMRRAVDGAFGCLKVRGYQRRGEARRPTWRMNGMTAWSVDRSSAGEQWPCTDRRCCL